MNKNEHGTILKFACCIPLYHPQMLVEKNLAIYAQIFSKVYIFDNTEGGSNSELLKTIRNLGNSCILSTGDNEGVAYAYNACSRQAVADGFDFIAIYDQDSYPDKENIERLRNYISNYYDASVAIYVPEIFHVGKPVKLEDRIGEVEVAISSGSFNNLAIYQKSPGFDENLFIDVVDDDYCMAVRGMGYRILRVYSCALVHDIGITKKFLLKRIEQHSPLRMYYIVRNVLYFRKKYGLPGGTMWILDRMRHVLLYDDDKILKICMMVRGYRDFKKCRMGKCYRKEAYV